MSLPESDPTGIVKVFIAPDGRVIAHAADFDKSAPGGFRSREAQEMRCRRALAYAVIDAFSSPVIGAAMDPYDAEKLIVRLTTQGYRIHTINVGDERPEPAGK